MGHQEQFACLLIEKTKEIAFVNKHTYIQEVSEWTARIFIENTKKEITHDYDPPWDSSGSLVDTQDSYELDNYTTLESFIENEYNGMTEASYVSGYGLFHNTYWTDLEELTRLWVSDQLKAAVQSLMPQYPQSFDEYIKEFNHLNEKTDTIEEVMTVLMNDDDLLDELIFGLTNELMVKIQKMNLAFLVKKSEKMMKKRVRKEKLEAARLAEERRKKRKIDKQTADKVWKQLVNRHKLLYKKNIPNKIERAYFRTHIQPIFQDMLIAGTNKEAIQTISQFYDHRMSNSVCSDLDAGRF